ncbi:MAG: para-aminobenzoate synthase component [Bacteroidetes bacterium]|jgi:para-aminobenzoate synthetase component 1|nr:para-aminobenzoate synthase component [Bacteroidota bacterium]
MEFEYNSHSFSSTPVEALLSFSGSYEVFTILNSNGQGESFELLAAFGMKELLTTEQVRLDDGQWKFGYVSYDLKNRIERLSSVNPDRIKAPDTFLFVPEIVIVWKPSTIEIIAGSSDQEAAIFRKLCTSFLEAAPVSQPVHLQESLSRQEYLMKITTIKEHIRRGDIYEMNFCMEFFAEAKLSPAHTYLDLNAISQAPFSFYSRFRDIYAIGSSPERFLKKEGGKLITQPIKGTAPRSADPKEDERLKEMLRNNEKERNENVMIVDVSRNDLSRIAKKGTVKVDELFGVYSFRQVHQLISTVSCELKDNRTFGELLQAAFPPASMTGAPKIRAMQIIEETESFKRGIYSGISGYITPNGDLDFNVVIRSILYNEKEKQVSYAAGSAITDKCNPEDEYVECLLKANAMRKVLEG